MNVWTKLAAIAICCLELIRPISLFAAGEKPLPLAAPGKKKPAAYTLALDHAWQLNVPENRRFDASALLILGPGRLATLSDRSATLYEIKLVEQSNAAPVTVISNIFTTAQLAAANKGKKGRYDAEGLAMDPQGRIYLSEESNRWILRFDPTSQKVERLPIDWESVEKYFDDLDGNASFEGVAVGTNNRLYVANERQNERIIVVDLNTFKIVDDFEVKPIHEKLLGMHYSDLSWFDGALYVLLRHGRSILKVDPDTHALLAEYDFSAIEKDPEYEYRTTFPTGTMEGLAVDQDYFYFVTDNNGQPRLKYGHDMRPTLFRCKRPDK